MSSRKPPRRPPPSRSSFRCGTRPDNIAPLVAEIAAALAGRGVRGHLCQRRLDRRHRSRADAPEGAASLAAADPARALVRAIGGAAHRRCRRRARRVIVTLDGDGQNDPAFLPQLVDALEQGAPRIGLVAGQRVGRKATASRNSSRASPTRVRGAILRDGTRDTGCGLKAFPRDLVPGAAVFRRAAPLPAGADPARRLRHRLCRCGRPAAPARHVELWILGPAVGRNSRSRRRVVADPPQEARAGDFGGVNARSICRTRSATICTTCS